MLNVAGWPSSTQMPRESVCTVSGDSASAVVDGDPDVATRDNVPSARSLAEMPPGIGRSRMPADASYGPWPYSAGVTCPRVVGSPPPPVRTSANVPKSAFSPELSISGTVEPKSSVTNPAMGLTSTTAGPNGVLAGAPDGGSTRGTLATGAR
jgi:hypothetical protein